MTTLIRLARTGLIVIEALALAVVLLYLGEVFDWNWVREAGGAR